MTLEQYQEMSDSRLYDLIARLKREREATFLVHNYQALSVQKLADFLGDSLALSQAATKVKAKTIVFCGVHFMAESAKLLNPEKTVLLPDIGAGCPMADMATPEAVRQVRAKYRAPIVVTYVNSSAAVKAESDICCTSSNAVQIVNSQPLGRDIIFLPDRNLGSYVAKMTGRNLILWPGYCHVHNRFTDQDVRKARERHPGARVIVHPECRPEVVEAADMVASTSGMVRAFREHPEVDQWVIGTEQGLIDQLSADYPRKKIYPLASEAICQHMKMITLAKVAWSLENLKHEITVPEGMAPRARLALERMLEASG